MACAEKKVVLAYSGGLDTSCTLQWLREKGYEVIAYVANVGQQDDFDALKMKALKIGALKVVIEDLREAFLTSYVWPAIACGLIYEDRYLLGTSIARPCIAEGLVRTAMKEGVSIIAHGATGKGNDQIRFELSCYALYPDVKILAPWREKEFYLTFPGRPDLLQYARKNGIQVSATPKEPWSMDANLLHISYESGILENPETNAPESLYKMTTDPIKSPVAPMELEIKFKEGHPKSVTNLKTGYMVNTPFKIIEYLNGVGGCHGVGRIDIVENRYIGLKSRGIYEAPGSKILYEAHQDLETLALDREVLRIKSYLTNKMSDCVYNGLWFSPECEFLRGSILQSQKYVSGTVQLKLYKGVVSVLGRKSDISLYNEDLVSMNVQGGFEPEDATGFIRIHALRLKEYYRVKQQLGS